MFGLAPTFSPGGQWIYYSVAYGPEEHRGRLGYDIAVDERFLYFLWREDVGDLWVMNVVTED